MNRRPVERFRSRYGRAALVVGGSEGLGAAFAAALAARGLDLVLVARRQPPLDDLATALRSRYGSTVTTIAMDAGVPGAAELIAERVAAVDLGLLVCVAADAPVGAFLDMDIAGIDRMIDLNCRLATTLGRLIGGRLVARGRGGMIFTSSMAGLAGCASVVQYAATKSYLRVLAEGLWVELAPHGVDVLACCPGLVRTPTFERSGSVPPGRMAPPIMEPGAVVQQTLAALGRRPVVIPGRVNRLAAFATQRLLPRAATITMTSKATTAMYPDGPGPS